MGKLLPLGSAKKSGSSPFEAFEAHTMEKEPPIHTLFSAVPPLWCLGIFLPPLVALSLPLFTSIGLGVALVVAILLLLAGNFVFALKLVGYVSDQSEATQSTLQKDIDSSLSHVLRQYHLAQAAYSYKMKGNLLAWEKSLLQQLQECQAGLLETFQSQMAIMGQSNLELGAKLDSSLKRQASLMEATKANFLKAIEEKIRVQASLRKKLEVRMQTCERGQYEANAEASLLTKALLNTHSLVSTFRQKLSLKFAQFKVESRGSIHGLQVLLDETREEIEATINDLEVGHSARLDSGQRAHIRLEKKLENQVKTLSGRLQKAQASSRQGLIQQRQEFVRQNRGLASGIRNLQAGLQKLQKTYQDSLQAAARSQIDFAHQIQDQANLLADLHDGLAGQAEQLGVLESLRAGLLGQIQQLMDDQESSKEGFNHQTQDLGAKLKESSLQIDGLANGLGQQSANLEALAKSQQALQDALQDTNGQLESATNQYRAVNQQLQGHAQRVNSLLGSLGAQEAELRKIAETQTGFDAGLSKAESKIVEQIAKYEELEQEKENLRKLIANNRDMLHKTKAVNYRHIYVHSRNLVHKDLLRFEEFWLPALGLELNHSALGYIAHKTCVIEDHCIGRMATSIQDAVLRVLLARSFAGQPLRSLEIGTLFGISIVTIHENCRGFHPSTKFFAIDPLDGFYQQGNDIFTGMPISYKTLEYNLRQSNVNPENIEVIPFLSTDKRAKAAVEGQAINLFVIDGDHTYDGVAYDFDNYAHLVEEGGLLLFDDYTQKAWPDVARFVDERVKGAPGWDLVGADWNSIVFRRNSETFPNENVPKPKRKTTRRKKRP
jgi:hypothetical protein